MNKYFEYQTQLCHDAEGAPDTESWERAHSFLIILILREYVGRPVLRPPCPCAREKTFPCGTRPRWGGAPPYGLSESFIVNYQEGRAAYGKSPDRFGGEQRQ